MYMREKPREFSMNYEIIRKLWNSKTLQALVGVLVKCAVQAKEMYFSRYSVMRLTSWDSEM